MSHAHRRAIALRTRSRPHQQQTAPVADNNATVMVPFVRTPEDLEQYMVTITGSPQSHAAITRRRPIGAEFAGSGIARTEFYERPF